MRLLSDDNKSVIHRKYADLRSCLLWRSWQKRKRLLLQKMKVIKSKIIHFPVIQRLQRAGNNNYTKNNYRQTINCHLRLSDIIFLYTICQPLMMLIMTPTTRRPQHSNGQCKSINHEWRKSTTDNLWQQPQKQKHKQPTANRKHFGKRCYNCNASAQNQKA